jgi:hypothetical protein
MNRMNLRISILRFLVKYKRKKMMKFKGRIYITVFLIFLLTDSCMVSRPEYSRRPYSRGQDYVTAQVFYDELSPYGHWVHNRQYDFVWIPNVGRNFYPYLTDGRWVMTDYGWTWVSDYDWGWAPFHYGRWDYDPYYGWIWFPDYEWAPAWVTWRMGDGYFGWAPMRPGMDIGMSYEGNIDPDRWIFVRENDFGRSNPQRYYISRRNNIQIIRNTTVINNYYTDNQRSVRYPAGPDPDQVQRSTGRRFNRYAVRDNNRPGERINNRELQIYRPRIERNVASGQRPAPRRITDMEDIKPERQRSATVRQNQEQRTDTRPVMQGRRENSRELDLDKVSRRKKEIQHENQLKQRSMQQRQIQIQEQQQQREPGDTGRIQLQQQQQQQQSQRQQQTDQQKREMRRQRESRKSDVVVKSRRKSPEDQNDTKSKEVQVKSRRRVQSDNTQSN